MNGNFAAWLILCLVVTSATTAQAGNRGMVEKSVEELKEVNEEALSQIPDRPSDGAITLRGEVGYSGGERRVRVDDYSIETNKGEVTGAGMGRRRDANQMEEGRIDVPVK